MLSPIELLPERRRSPVRVAGMAVALVLAAACHTTTTTPTASVPPPPVQLLDAARFDLPADCAVSAGRTYRMSYTVGGDGRTGNLGAITPADAPACLQAALATWVGSFRYAPPAQAESVTTDWMLVTARRGS
jgi:hypothetical protein